MEYWKKENWISHLRNNVRFQEYKERVKKRIQLIRTLWQLAEALGEGAVENALNALKSAPSGPHGW